MPRVVTLLGGSWIWGPRSGKTVLTRMLKQRRGAPYANPTTPNQITTVSNTQHSLPPTIVIPFVDLEGLSRFPFRWLACFLLFVSLPLRSTLVPTNANAFQLFQAKSRTKPLGVANSLVQKLITLTVETGMLTSIVAIMMDLVFFLALTNSGLHFFCRVLH